MSAAPYIYPDQSSAVSDEGFGGSGFVVARYVPGGYQTFVVTNRHVIEGALDPVIRLNRINGGTESFPTNRSWWRHHPDGDDLSAYQLEISTQNHRQAWIWQDGFIGRVEPGTSKTIPNHPRADISRPKTVTLSSSNQLCDDYVTQIEHRTPSHFQKQLSVQRTP
ncbi:MAG TPA: hypothetical protein VNW54_00775 [Granulicella sp.]|jgi:hypothetical protein|nr:hypothetical protein [Granulicella sp.]